MVAKRIIKYFILLFVSVLVSCDGTKFVEDGSYLLTKNTITSTDKKVSTNGLSAYIRQKPNTKWFSTFKVPLGIYSMAGRDTTKAINRRLMKWGEAPVVLDTAMVFATTKNLTDYIRNDGYLNATVTPEIDTKGRRASVHYVIEPHQQYSLHSLNYDIADHNIDSLLRQAGFFGQGSLLRVGEPFSINKLYDERNAITTWLNNNGFYYFNQENITFVADSSSTARTVDVTMRLGLYRRSSRDSLEEHPRYRLRNVTYEPLAGQKLNIRQSTLLDNTLLESGNFYSASDIQRTYNDFSRLKAIRATNIHLTEVQDSILYTPASILYTPASILYTPASILYTPDSILSKHQLDAVVQIVRRKPHSIQVQPEGTNTAGDFGAALSVTYENRNIFHGSEQLSVTARGAFEAIHGLEGYDNSNYEEFGIETKLTFPKFMIPGLSHRFNSLHEASTELPISYNIQNRPEFHRRVLSAAWRYKWNANNDRVSYHFDLIDLNFLSMPWISDTFKHDYLDTEGTRSAILRYNYQDLMIMKIGFGFNYTDEHNSLRTSIETAGNLLSTVSGIFNFRTDSLGQRMVANVAFAQYVKLDADYTHLIKLDSRNSLALHSRIGIAVPYGNSDMLPYEKRYFAGGANSVRGWNVRGLGPGHFKGKDGRIDFINQTGDIKIDLNAELRTNMFWKFQGAIFIDAGNIWTIRKYSDQEGGEFTLRSLYEDMAVAYGIGLRLNFDYFILRLDLGMKAIDPAYTSSEEHFPITHMNFSRDYALHFAVGLPF